MSILFKSKLGLTAAGFAMTIGTLGWLGAISATDAQAILNQRQGPKLTIWTFDYPQDLTFLKNESSTQIAYLAGLARIVEGRVYFRRNKKTLKIPTQMSKFPVIRVETAGKINNEAIDPLVKVFLDEVKRSGAKKLQVDFDAREDERQFYASFLQKLKENLTVASLADVKISITALASWSLEPDFLPSVVDERVLMLFSMGKDEDKVLAALSNKIAGQSGGDALCLGIGTFEGSVNEKIGRLFPKCRNWYVFNAHSWSEASYARAKKLVKTLSR